MHNNNKKKNKQTNEIIETQIALYSLSARGISLLQCQRTSKRRSEVFEVEINRKRVSRRGSSLDLIAKASTVQAVVAQACLFASSSFLRFVCGTWPSTDSERCGQSLSLSEFLHYSTCLHSAFDGNVAALQHQLMFLNRLCVVLLISMQFFIIDAYNSSMAIQLATTQQVRFR